MLKPGMILCDRYEILDIVGAGGMSIVYKARCHRLNRNVAIKVLKPEFSNDTNFVTKFRIEAQASAGLSHPNIVNVYDVYDDDGIYFIVMELVEGITLKQYIQDNGRLPMDKAIDFSIQIAAGLEAAHDSHIIHRDIKPQNIIVSKNGNIKVTDFGIAKAASSNTLTSGAMGSVHYISPEQARGGFSDERSDIYSLGITMYEMVTGRVPFEGDNNVSVALMHIQSDMIPPRQYYPEDIYSSYEKIILKATQKKPERRYLTASAMIADLRRVQNNPNIDIVVAPTSITNSPTQEWTKEEVKAIRGGSASRDVYSNNMYGNNPYDNSQLNAFNNPPVQNEMGELRPVGGISPIPVNNNKINQLLDDDSWEEEYEEEYEAPVKKSSIKKVQDYDEDYEEEEDDDESDIDPSLRKAVTIAGIATAVIIAILAMVFISKAMGWNVFGNKENKTTAAPQSNNSTEQTISEIAMVDVRGVKQESAIDMLKNLGFKNIKTQMVEEGDAQPGYVVAQNYEHGAMVPEDAEIILSIKAEAKMVTVPDVTGYEDAQATVLLEEAGFVVRHAYKHDEEVEKDKVISQSPEGNTSVAEGSEVIITVSNGSEKKKVMVPNLSGYTEEQAISALEAVKLRAGNITHQHDETVPKGMVISQNPASNVELTEGDPVDFVISDGPEEKKITYTANIAGTITSNDPALDGTAVTVQVVFNGAVVYELPLDGLTAGSTYNVNAQVFNLEAEGGSADFVILDAAGNNVTGSFTKGTIQISYQKVEE